ncbi:YveK family protein [Neobacillus drentensis]|uniref:YveK family protein n=1 Tax=Neobacillus drentensis TaxID=220684 RepID=UPI0028633432|nr:Wzz/FepE/Etk N-terminal domain-containing protein [Neobacillus drentensis]MDR7239992.1 capsular polysaccharide biosynthesis protein [Neobacillus drentensis]
MNNFIDKKNARDINLKELYYVIKKRFWIILVLMIITTGLGVYLSDSKDPPLYESSSRIIIGANPENSKTLQVIIKDTTILEKVVQQLNLSQSPEEIAGQITVTSVDSSQVVSISVTDTDPERAAKIANTTARVFKEQIPNIMDFKDVRLLSDAKVNPSQINKSQNNTTLIALIAGLVLGIGLVFLLDSLDETLRTDQEVEGMLELPVLGRVSKSTKKNLKRKYVKQVNLEARGETIGFK